MVSGFIRYNYPEYIPNAGGVKQLAPALLRPQIGSQRRVIDPHLRNHPGTVRIYQAYMDQPAILLGPVQHPAVRRRGRLDLSAGSRRRLLADWLSGEPEPALTGRGELSLGYSQRRFIIVLVHREPVFEKIGRAHV